MLLRQRVRPPILLTLFASAMLIVSLVAGGVSLQATAQEQADPVTDLGEAVQKRQVLASATGTAPDGTPLAYYVVSGNQNVTAEFTVVNLRTEETVLQTRLPYGASSQRALAISPVDGTVYFGTSDVGHIYRYVPGADDVEHLGAIPDGARTWSMAVDEDGTPWFGAYPTGALYSLDPDTGDITNHGQAVAGEQYINAIARVGDTVYVGTQQNAKLAAYDLSTGEFTEVAMPAGHEGTSIKALDVRDGLMFVSTTKIHVRDLASGTWVDEISGANARVSPIDPNDPDAVYLRQGREIMRYDLTTGELSGTGKAPNATPESWSFVDRDGTGPFLTLTYWRQGRTYSWNLENGNGYYFVPELWGAGAPLISLGTGPQGNVYTGAFLSPPGMGKYDPDGTGIELLNSTSQVEGYGTFGDKLVFGRYPQGSLYVYDPSQPWDYRTNPENPMAIGDAQSRTKAFVELDAVPGTVAVASVPDPGQHGGAITLWQPDDGTHEVFRDVVADQSLVALVERQGVLVGGTSIQGGYGIDPVTDEAVLFAWDPTTKETQWTAAPVPGATTVAGLAVDDEGHVWGVADGRHVFEFDPATGETLRTVTIDADASIARYGDDDRLLFDHGRLFGSVADRLFVLDQVTNEVTSLYGKNSGRDDGVTQVHELTQDRYGDLYVISSNTQLTQYDLPDDVTAPEVTARTGNAPAQNGRAIWLDATDDTDSSPVIEARVDDGDWQQYQSGQMFVVLPGTELEYRAVDSAWNSSPVHTYPAD